MLMNGAAYCSVTVVRKPLGGTTGAGFSLVEVLIAAVILSISLLSIVAFVRKGHEQIAFDRHRRFARGIIDRTLESARFQPESYTDFDSAPPPVVTVETIDPKTKLTGTLTVTVGLEEPSIQGAAVPHRHVKAAVVWNEELNKNVVKPETVNVEKWLTKVERR
jgi:prepilin-type N-terminal cleavage/methylation domain-containing protein